MVRADPIGPGDLLVPNRSLNTDLTRRRGVAVPVGRVSCFSKSRTIKEALLGVCGEALRHSELLAREENRRRRRLGKGLTRRPPCLGNDGKLSGAFSRGRN